MVNRVVSSFQHLRASSLVPAFVLNLMLSIFFFGLYYLYFTIGAFSAYSHCNFLCFLFSCCCCVFQLHVHPLFSVIKVWFDSFWFLREKSHQIVCIATWTGVLNDEACFLFFFFSFFFINIVSSYRTLRWFCSFALLYSFSLFLLLSLFFFFHAYF